MGWASRNRTRVLIGFVAVVAIITVLVSFVRRYGNGQRQILIWSKSPQDKSAGGFRMSPTPEVNPGLSSAPSPAANASPTFQNTVTPTPTGSPFTQTPGAEPNNLIVPVAGVRPDQLRDTFSESRSEGRVHDAIDIPAPLDTPVFAAADGTIVKLFQSERGGTTIYQLSTDNRFVYYYAHLDRYAEGLMEGHFAKQGETIAYVGDSGNAGAGNYHLHFSIALISDPKHYWQGVNINPYPVLKR
jgi:peptidoglycan LD-endopeptidase LytH